jgi:hypothetical protein
MCGDLGMRECMGECMCGSIYCILWVWMCVSVWVLGWLYYSTALFAVNAFLLFSFCLDNALFTFQHLLGRIPGP